VLFGTQASTAPPTFVLFTSGMLEASYLRFVERRLREEFGFTGTPVHVHQRPRKRDKK
jgi:GTP-binding protein